MSAPKEDPETLARQYASAVYRLAYARTGSRADAEDVMQETFLRLLKARPVFNDGAHAKAWLLRVAANCANDLFRLPWRRREEPLEEGMTAPAGPEPGGVVEAVFSLPAKYRIPVHLHYFEGYSVAEIAQITGRREGTVKSQLFRARTLLREKLEDAHASDGI